MTTNLQLPTTEPKKQKQTKQSTRTGTESQKWRSHGGFISGEVNGEENGGKCTGNKNTNGRYKIDRGRLRIVWEIGKPKNLYV